MGVNDNQRPSRGTSQRTPHLPRHIIEHIGLVLRNRFREELLLPVPDEMLDRLTRMRPAQGVAPVHPGPKLEGGKPQLTGWSNRAPEPGS